MTGGARRIGSRIGPRAIAVHRQAINLSPLGAVLGKLFTSFGEQFHHEFRGFGRFASLGIAIEQLESDFAKDGVGLRRLESRFEKRKRFLDSVGILIVDAQVGHNPLSLGMLPK